jgi:hypothetical protein
VYKSETDAELLHRALNPKQLPSEAPVALTAELASRRIGGEARTGLINPGNRWFPVRFRTSTASRWTLLKTTVRQQYSLVLWHQEVTFRTRLEKALL